MKTSRTKTTIGWILSGLIGLFLLGASGLPKFAYNQFGMQEMMQTMMDHLGISMSLLPTLGVIEVTVAILYLIPRTSFLGAILATGLLGGAVFTHLRVGDGLFEILFPVVLGVIMWIGLALRHPILFSLALGQRSAWNDDERKVDQQTNQSKFSQARSNRI